MRRDDLFVTALVQIAAEPLLQKPDDPRALGKVQGKPDACGLVHHVNAQLTSELAMIALLRFCEIMQMRGKLLLLEERRAIQALKHLAL